MNDWQKGEWAVTRKARLSKRLSVAITVGPGGMVCEWFPGLPKEGAIIDHLTNQEASRYREARNSLLAELAEKIGGKVAVVEV